MVYPSRGWGVGLARTRTCRHRPKNDHVHSGRKFQETFRQGSDDHPRAQDCPEFIRDRRGTDARKSTRAPASIYPLRRLGVTVIRANFFGDHLTVAGEQAMNSRQHGQDRPTDPTGRPGRGGNVPPIEHRWQKGQSANPAGRPRGSEDSFEATIRRELNRRVAGDPNLDGNRRVTRRTRLARAILDRAEAGDARLATMILDRVWPVPAHEMSPTQPVVVVFDDQDRRELQAADGE